MATRRRRAPSVLTVVVLLLAACSAGEDAAAPDPAGERSQTGSAPTAEESTPGEAPAFQALTLAAGDQHACALDAEGAAWCWGYNRFGQLGNGSTEDSTVPVPVAGGLRLTELSAGRYFTCALDTDGASWCWGDNSRGQLGNGSTGRGSDEADRAEPVRVRGDLSFTMLATGQLHACGLTAAGAAWCWGAHPSGQLGNAASDDQTRPRRAAEDLTLVALAAAGANTCGLDSQQAAWCWGNNSFGQLGNGVTDNAAQPVPVRVRTDVPLASLALGRAHACALDVDGAAWCWGSNNLGQVGDATFESRLEPVRVVGGHVFEKLTAGVRHTCGVDGQQAAWCWGDNGSHQLGAAADGGRHAEPVAVSEDLGFVRVAPGEEFTCAVAAEGGAYCWGSNRSGWLGHGTTEDRVDPAAVLPAGAGS